MRFLALSLLVFAAACGPDETTEPTFANVQTRVFDLSCTFSSCHSGPSSAGGMNLMMNACANIVNVPSQQNASLMRVKPSDPDASYLMRALLGMGEGASTLMPEGAMLEQERLDLVKAWIEAGAPCN